MRGELCVVAGEPNPVCQKHLLHQQSCMLVELIESFQPRMKEPTIAYVLQIVTLARNMLLSLAVSSSGPGRPDDFPTVLSPWTRKASRILSVSPSPNVQLFI